MSASPLPSDYVYVGLGSNLGDRAGNLLLAIRSLLAAGLDIARLSSIYETEPVETFAQPAFLNMVAELRGDRLPSPDHLMETLLAIERQLGRIREVPLGPRLIDLDFLLYGERLQATPILSLPHPRMHQRRFVLEPLAELCPHLVHPALKQTIAQLLATTKDNSEVRLWQPQQSSNLAEEP
ncbi:MAG: 2-amino-4-hydroxy-6-hydroxymethyldihydropteridine pyrophosphokinae [Acidobacteria bacterium]|nr:2-amino-4-hydroxy-6-hydroxymethyldihydropteridine pyrophosphokinae [Acidobacteriota bacterium]